MPACRRHYPGRSDGNLFARTFPSSSPSPKFRRVGPCIAFFEACSAFTHVTAYRLAKSPMRPSTPEASAASLPPLLLRLLPGGTNQFPGGTSPTVDQHLFTAHRIIQARDIFLVLLKCRLALTSMHDCALLATGACRGHSVCDGYGIQEGTLVEPWSRASFVFGT
jgi:hypothetical protein